MDMPSFDALRRPLSHQTLRKSTARLCSRWLLVVLSSSLRVRLNCW